MSTAGHGIQFLRKVNPYERAKTPRLVVVDVTLPEHDGFWLLTEVRKDPELQPIPVLVLGIEPAFHHVPKAAALRAQAYIEKSFDFESFAQQVKAVCSFLNCN